MTAYYVLGITMVVGAVVLSAIGLTREGFPPNKRVARGILAGTLVLVLVGAVVLVSTTHVEHPKAEAAEKAAEKAAELDREAGEAGATGAAGQAEGGGQTVRATEKEFSIKLDKGNTLQAGKYRFQVINAGKVEHDLEIDGNGVKEKTALIAPGNEAALEAQLKPAKYRFWCTVPGHAQAGMDIDVNVR